MNKIIPFHKEIKFSDNIGEITSIALDDTLKFSDNYTIKGELIVRGCHQNEVIKEDFSYPLPVEITVDKKYDTSKAKIMVDDFYYEIINDDTLKVKIDLILDDLFYQEERQENVENIDISEEINEEPSKKEEIDVLDLFKETSDEKEYSIYRVYVICENDNIDSILNKYKISREELEHFNDLTNFKPGIKLIIPSIDE